MGSVQTVEPVRQLSSVVMQLLCVFVTMAGEVRSAPNRLISAKDSRAIMVELANLVLDGSVAPVHKAFQVQTVASMSTNAHHNRVWAVLFVLMASEDSLAFVPKGDADYDVK